MYKCTCIIIQLKTWISHVRQFSAVTTIKTDVRHILIVLT